MVTMVLLNDAWMCASPCGTCFRSFFLNFFPVLPFFSPACCAEDPRLQYVPCFLFTSALALLVLGVFADHAHHTVASNDLALVTDFLYGCPNLH